jgi:hypothetical protein
MEESSDPEYPSSVYPKDFSIDEVLENIPIGRFHYWLLFICGLAFAADSMEVCLYVSYSLVILIHFYRYPCCPISVIAQGRNGD